MMTENKKEELKIKMTYVISGNNQEDCISADYNNPCIAVLKPDGSEKVNQQAYGRCDPHNGK